MAWARTVAVVVPSPATSEVFEATSRTIWAPMFSRPSFSSISFATVTPSLVTVGEPNFFSITTLRPLGPNVTLTVSASRFTPANRLRRDSSPNAMFLAISFSLLISGKIVGHLFLAFCFGGFSLNHAEDVILSEDQVLFVVDLDFGARIFAKENPISFFDVELN